MMAKFIFRSPSSYIQGQGVLKELGEQTKKIGASPLLLADEVVWEIVQETVEESFDETDISYTFEEFGGEASTEEFDRLADIGKDNDADVVVGLGGGKTLDTAKAVSDELGVPVIIVPTTASTDAPTSALSVVYSDDGVFETYKFYDKNPDLVLLDTEVAIQAPIEFFASGMSDALATLVEVKAAVKRNADNMVGGKPTLAGQAIAEKCEETLFTYGKAAYEAAKEGIVTPQVDYIVEANTLLSGLGFENGGLAGAHAIHNGFTAISGDIHDLSHGQKVSYGILVQLVLEGKPTEEIKKYAEFLSSIEMPTTLDTIHLDEASFEDLVEIGKVATADGETMENLDPEITPEQIANAILAVDKIVKG